MKSFVVILLLVVSLPCSARQITVSDYPAIHDACQNALPGDTIIITSGVYTIEGNNRIMVTNRPGPVLVTGETDDPRDVTIQGVNMDSDIVEMIFNLDNCPQWTFQGFTARNTYYHAFKFDRGSSDCTIRNVYMLDNGESGVKGTSDNVAKVYPDRLLVENCKIGYTKTAGSDHPQVEGIDGVAENDWIIRGNRFVNIQKSAFDKAAYAVFTKGNSSRTIIEGNRFEDCFIGASFGGGGTDPVFFRDNDQTYEHRDGIISNNVFIRCSDAAVYINKGTNCKIYNNTLIQCVLTIQLRFKESSGYIKNNLVLLSSSNATEPLLRLRDGATLLGEAANRSAGGQEFLNIIGLSAYVDAGLRDLSPAIDSGVTLTEVPNDFIGTQRPQGKAYDIGAYEFIPPTSVQEKLSANTSLQVIYSPSGPMLRISLPYRSHIELAVFDALGREAALLANGNYEQGNISFTLPSSLAGGIYIGSLQYRDYNESVKILIK